MREEVSIERMGYGPEAIAHLSNGKTVFVAGGAPGDVAIVEVTAEKPTFARARVCEILASSDRRISIPKGGKGVKAAEVGAEASWAHLSYGTQLEAKRANLCDALVRVGHFEGKHVEALVEPTVPSKHEWGYRNKIELAAFRDEAGRFSLGFHEHASDAIVAVQTAPLANRLIERAPKALTGALRYLQGNDDLGIYRVGVRGSLRTKNIEVALWTPPSSFPRGFAAKTIRDAVGATSIVRVIADPGKARRVKRIETLDGSGFWTEKMHDGGEESVQEDFLFSVSAPSFFQVNTPQAEKLVELVLDMLQPDETMTIADLYSGVGTFTLPLACTGAEVCAIELAGSSVRDLRQNCVENDVDVDVICDDTAIALPALGALDGVVVDPPRSGLEVKVIDQLADAAPARIIYVSCDPQTFARDAGRLKERGYELRRAVPVDMFPQTYHVETVGVFGRSQR